MFAWVNQVAAEVQYEGFVSSAERAMAVARGGASLRRRAYRCGALPQVRGRVRVIGSGRLSVGDRVTVVGTPLPTKLEVGRGGQLKLGDATFVNFGVDINAQVSITIGDHVRIAPLVSIVDDDWHQVEPSRPRRRAPVVIEPDVWLGRLVTVLPGVTIGRGSVVAAGSVVSRSIPSGVLAAGSPARPIRTLSVPDDWHR